MKPRSSGSWPSVAPAAIALRTSASTSSRLSIESENSASVALRGSVIGTLDRVEKNASDTSMTLVRSLMTRAAPFSLVKSGLNEKPRASKKSTLRSRSFTGRVT